MWSGRVWAAGASAEGLGLSEQHGRTCVSGSKAHRHMDMCTCPRSCRLVASLSQCVRKHLLVKHGWHSVDEGAQILHNLLDTVCWLQHRKARRQDGSPEIKH